jgi:hypothetical protein
MTAANPMALPRCSSLFLAKPPITASTACVPMTAPPVVCCSREHSRVPSAWHRILTAIKRLQAKAAAEGEAVH